MRLVTVELYILDNGEVTSVYVKNGFERDWKGVKPLPLNPNTNCVNWNIYDDKKNKVLIRLEHQVY